MENWGKEIKPNKCSAHDMEHRLRIGNEKYTLKVTGNAIATTPPASVGLDKYFLLATTIVAFIS